MRPLKNKRILITAGPTWVAIDRVRVISNIASGETGRLLASQAHKMGARVTLLLGPVGNLPVTKGVRVLRFDYFSELYSLIKKELCDKDYAVVIHSAAVSDYQPKIYFKHKVKSGIRDLGLELSPTLRIVDKIKHFNPQALLVAFKLEFGLDKNKLIAEANKLSKRTNADLVVANTFKKNRYTAWIVDRNGQILTKVCSKPSLVVQLIKLIKARL